MKFLNDKIMRRMNHFEFKKCRPEPDSPWIAHLFYLPQS